MSLPIRPRVKSGISPDTIFANLVKELFETTKTRYVSYADQKAALLEVISPDVTTVNFAEVIDLFPDYHSYVIDVLVTIASRAQNMKDFQIMEGLIPIPIIYWYSMNLDMVDGIAIMKNLRILKVQRFSISFSLLLYLCGQLPSLKNLYFRIDSLADFNIEDFPTFKRNFGNLDIFQFNPTSDDSDLNHVFLKNLTSECIWGLPNLQLVGDPDSFVNMMDICMTNERLCENGESKLTYMTLFVRKDVHQELSTFPNVEHLHTVLENPSIDELDVSGLLRFPKLSKLTMTCLRYPLFAHHIDEFLAAYKKNLTHLTLELNATMINLKDVFEGIFPRCRKLQQLILRDFQPKFQPKWSMPSCDSLRELELEFSFECARNRYVYISNILSVPNLEKVRLIRVPTTLEELAFTVHLVKKKKILKKVNHLELELCENSYIFRTKECGTTQAWENLESSLRDYRKEAYIEVKLIRLQTALAEGRIFY